MDTETSNLLRDAFSNPDLPIKADIAEWQRLDRNFQNIIASNYEVLYTISPSVP